jgi:hypothetical protein
MVNQCPTCHRRSISCPACGQIAVDDAAGDLPLWCPSCGVTLRKTLAEREAESQEDIGHFIMQVRASSAALQPRHAALLVLAVVCGLLAAAFTYGLLGPPREPVPGLRIVRETYSIQPPEQEWRFSEGRWRAERSDLALEATYRGGHGAQFLVHVIRPPQPALTLDNLVEQTKRQWSDPLRDWHFLDGEGGPTIVANQPAVRIVAVSAPYPATRPDRFAGDRLRREAVLLVHDGIGYRLTAEQYDHSFERMRSRFNKFVTSFHLLSGGEAEAGNAAP